MSLSLLSKPCTSRAGAVLAYSTFHHSLSLIIARSELNQYSFLDVFKPSLNRLIHVSNPVWTSHFDTHLFVQHLEKHGMTRQQAEGVMTVLAEVVDESVKGMESSLVSKAEQEKVDTIVPC